MRTVAEGRGDTLYVGTTRNSILQGSVHTGFSLLVQVSAPPTSVLLLGSSHLSSQFYFTPPSCPIPFPLACQTPLSSPLPAPTQETHPCPSTPSQGSLCSSSERVTSWRSRGSPGPCHNHATPALLFRGGGPFCWLSVLAGGHMGGRCLGPHTPQVPSPQI